MKDMTPSIYEGMAHALADTKAADMVNFVQRVDKSYKVDTFNANQWYSVAKEGGVLVMKDIPGLEITFGIHDDGNAGDAGILEAIQNKIEIGIATKLNHGISGSVALFYDVDETDVRAKTTKLGALLKDGFEYNGKTVTVHSITFPTHYKDAHKDFLIKNGDAASHSNYACAINPDAVESLQIIRRPKGAIHSFNINNPVRSPSVELSQPTASEEPISEMTVSEAPNAEMNAPEEPIEKAAELNSKPTSAAATSVYMMALSLIALLMF
jgi:hypothetical protein